MDVDLEEVQKIISLALLIERFFGSDERKS